VTRGQVTQVTDYQQGIDTLALRSDKCLSCGGNCVELKWVSGAIKCQLFLVEP